jgi:hypothetical protein
VKSRPDNQNDPAAELTPPVTPQAPWRVAKAEALPGFQLRMIFNGTAGIIEMADLINLTTDSAFAALRGERVFRKARVVLGAVTWRGEPDLAPDAMRGAIKEQGRWPLT